MTRQLFQNIELSVVYEVSKILTSTNDLAQSTLAVVNVLDNFLGMRDGTIMLYDRETSRLKPFVSLGISEKEIETYTTGLSVNEMVFKSGSPIVINDIPSEPTLSKDFTPDHDSLKNYSYICTPIKERRKMIGTISVFIKKKNYILTYENSVKLLSMISSLIAQSIKLSSLVKEEKEKLKQEKMRLEQELKQRHNLKNVIGESKKLIEIAQIVTMVAPKTITVILRGESGTGKELIARAIHYNSDRAKKPFVKVNCTALPENLLEAELFGHVKGAFTGANSDRIGRFELADGGTFFLDEIGDLPITTQVKLLRVIQEKKFERVGSSKTISVDVRLIAATNKNLEEAIKNGTFREDLYYRLNVVPIFMPPIRERKEDIPLLLDHFLNIFNKENNKSIRLSNGSMTALLEYSWPGNVRELENLIQRLVVLSETQVIEPQHLPYEIRTFNNRTMEQAATDTGNIGLSVNLSSQVENLEKDKIVEALKKCGWVKTRAAKLLGMTARQLDYRVSKYAIDIQRPWD